MYIKYWSLVVLFVLGGLLFSPMIQAQNLQELTDQELINLLRTGSIDSLKTNEQLWGKYLISEENSRQSESLVLTLDQLSDQKEQTILRLETLSSNKESELTTVYSYWENSKDAYNTLAIREKIVRYTLFGVSIIAIIELLIIIF